MKKSKHDTAPIDAMLRARMESELINSRGLRRRRWWRALDNDRAFRRVRNEFMESLAAHNGYASPEQMMLNMSSDDVVDSASDDKFDWDAFLEFMLQMLEIMVKLFL